MSLTSSQPINTVVSLAQRTEAVAFRCDGLDRITFFLLWCFVFTVPFEREFMVPGLGTISRIVGIVLLPCATLALIARGWVRSLVPAHWLMVLFVGWTSLSICWSLAVEATHLVMLTEIQCLVLVILIWQFCFGSDAAFSLVKAYVCGTVISCGSTILHFLSHQRTEWGRYAAEGFDPNDLSLTLALSIPFSYYFFLRAKGWRCWGWLVQIAAVVAACLLTASRMGAVVVVLALAVIPLTVRQISIKRLVVLFILVGIAGAVVAVIVPASSWQRIFTIQSEVSTGTLNGRTALWAGGVEAFTHRPWIGAGAGAFADATDPFLSYPEAGHQYVAHNTYLSILTELGIVGFVLFVGILGKALGSVSRMDPLQRRVWLLNLLVWAVGVATLTFEQRKPTWVLLSLLIQCGYPLASTAATVVGAGGRARMQPLLSTAG